MRNKFVGAHTSAAGGVQVEIQTIEGISIPGYSLEDSQILIGNEIKRVVSWGNKTDLSELSGKPIRLLFKLKDADLYSLKFE